MTLPQSAPVKKCWHCTSDIYHGGNGQYYTTSQEASEHLLNKVVNEANEAAYVASPAGRRAQAKWEKAKKEARKNQRIKNLFFTGPIVGVLFGIFLAVPMWFIPQLFGYHFSFETCFIVSSIFCGLWWSWCFVD
jgi:hypothetical protein